jgi:hypothetical protein
MKESLGQEEKCVPVAILEEMRISALRILEKIRSDNTGEAEEAMQQYDALVDRFYQANAEFMVPGQYLKAKHDAEYFIHLLDLAIGYSATSGQRELSVSTVERS